MASMSDVIGFKKDFQKQVASIMEMLSKTAVAEMCKLFEDGYSCLHLGMEQERQRIKREYNSLKEELQMMKQSVAQRNNNGGTASTENGEVLGMPMCTCQCSRPLAENQVNSPFQGAVLMACYEFPEVKQEPPDICQDNVLEMGMLLTSETTVALKSESEFETSFPSGGPTPDAEDSSCLDATDPSSQSTQSSDTLDSKSISASMPPRRTRLKRRLGPNKEPYPCHLCRKTFSQYTSLEAHMRVHTGEKPYKCDECGKRFSQIGNLNMHLKIHTGERQFSCTVCGKKFMTLGNLNSHIQTHRSGKAAARGRKGRPKIGRRRGPEGGDARTMLFPCQRCGKLFARANLLRKHQENQCQ